MSRPPTDIKGTADRQGLTGGTLRLSTIVGERERREYRRVTSLSRRIIACASRLIRPGGARFLFPAVHPKVASRLRGQRGFSLIEVLVAVGIFGLIGPAFLISINIAYRANQIADEQIQAAALARSQLDSILAGTYQTCDPTPCYTLISNIPFQYTVVITPQPIDTPNCLAVGNCNTLQVVTVSVSRPTGGGASRTVLSISAYKGKR